jgi:MoaA/NifB/PqqE/SkfB family radical SAM enzyme
MKKPLCTFPWAHLDIETNGDIKYCCASLYDTEHSFLDETGNHYNINTHSIDEAWNSDRIRELRRKLYNGIKAPECGVCWEQEAKGQWSVRQAAQAAEKDCYPDIQETADRSAENDFYVDGKPKYYQIQTGNLCNLACKMCHSDYSTTYGNFYFELYPDDVNQHKYIKNKNNSKRQNTKPARYEWPVKIGLKNLIDSDKLQHITRLFLSGGEPTIILENLRFLEYLVETGHSKHIHLIIATNTTKINPIFAESIKYFQNTTLLLSIDATGDPVEIQRYPAKWNQLQKNVDQYVNIGKNYPNINVALNVVVSVLTLPTVDHLIDFVGNYNKKLDITAMFSLDYGDLNLSIVPIEIVKDTCVKIKKSLTKNYNNLPDNAIQNIKQFIDFLENFPYNHNNDYSEVHFALETIQKHHPNRDIKSIFPVYFS